MKVAKFIVAGGNPRAPALNDSPALPWKRLEIQGCTVID